ncbi:DoxX-like family protein [Flaviaesturariibacter terrae]
MPLLHRIVRIFIAFVWLVNGLWAKLLHAVPRHEAIVARFVGTDAAPLLTRLIGAAEIVMGLWWLSGYRRRANTILQLIVVATMNTLEAIFARDLLLWGPWNAAWAALFCGLVAWGGLRRNAADSLTGTRRSALPLEN